MFHFVKKEREKEIKFLNRLITESKANTTVTICIQNTGKKVEILNSIIEGRGDLEMITRDEFIYKYEDKESGHSSETSYRMVAFKKVGA